MRIENGDRSARVRLLDDANAAEIRFLSRRSSSTFDPSVEKRFLSQGPLGANLRQSKFDLTNPRSAGVRMGRRQGRHCPYKPRPVAEPVGDNRPVADIRMRVERNSLEHSTLARSTLDNTGAHNNICDD